MNLPPSFRSTGRSVRRAVNTVQQALASPGTWITVMDHNDLHDSHLTLAQQVSTVLRTLGVAHEMDMNKVRVKPIVKRRK